MSIHVESILSLNTRHPDVKSNLDSISVCVLKLHWSTINWTWFKGNSFETKDLFQVKLFIMMAYFCSINARHFMLKSEKRKFTYELTV